jgi:hypothetical protein
MLHCNNAAPHNKEAKMNAQVNLDMINEMGTKGFESMRELGEINLRNWERMVARQMASVSLMMETGLRQAKAASEVKGYNELAKIQVEFAKELGQRMVEETRQNLKLAGDARDEYRVWLEKGMSNVKAKMAQATAKAA